MAVFKIDSLDLLQRHVTGDWGECDLEDAVANVAALASHRRVLSVYRLDCTAEAIALDAAYKFAFSAPGSVLWCITEADRSVTTLLLPSEY